MTPDRKPHNTKATDVEFTKVSRKKFMNRNGNSLLVEPHLKAAPPSDDVINDILAEIQAKKPGGMLPQNKHTTRN